MTDGWLVFRSAALVGARECIRVPIELTISQNQARGFVFGDSVDVDRN